MGLLNDISGYLPDYLPDDPEKREAARAGLLSLGAGLLASRSPNFGVSLGNGAAAGISAYRTSVNDEQKQRLQNAQLKILQNKDAREQRLMGAGMSMLGMGPGGDQGPTPSISGGLFGSSGGYGAGMPNASPSVSPSTGPMPAAAPTQPSALPSIDGAQPPTFQKIPPPSWLQPSMQQQPTQAPAPSPTGAPMRGPFGGGLRSMTPEQAVAFQMIGGPDVSKAMELAQRGIKFEAGNTYRDPYTGKERYFPKLENGLVSGSDGSVSIAPGYVPSIANVTSATEEAKEGAKAKLDPFYGVDSRGNKVLMGSRHSVMTKGAGNTANQTVPGVPDRPGPVMVERSPADTAYDTDTAKEFAQRYSAISKADFTAPSQIAKLQRIGKLLDEHDGGKLSQTGLELAQYANSMGIKIDKKLANKEAASALSNEIALSLRDPSSGAGMPGAMSDADRTFLASMSPNLSQSRDGRNQLISTSVSVHRRNQKVASMARQYQKRYGKVDEGFYDQLQSWADRNPLFGGK